MLLLISVTGSYCPEFVFIYNFFDLYIILGELLSRYLKDFSEKFQVNTL